MKCKRCGSHKQKVIDSRAYDGHKRRIRKCEVCGEVWATVEVPESEYGGTGEVQKYVAVLVGSLNGNA